MSPVAQLTAIPSPSINSNHIQRRGPESNDSKPIGFVNAIGINPQSTAYEAHVMRLTPTSVVLNRKNGNTVLISTLHFTATSQIQLLDSDSATLLSTVLATCVYSADQTQLLRANSFVPLREFIFKPIATSTNSVSISTVTGWLHVLQHALSEFKNGNTWGVEVLNGLHSPAFPISPVSSASPGSSHFAGYETTHSPRIKARKASLSSGSMPAIPNVVMTSPSSHNQLRDRTSTTLMSSRKPSFLGFETTNTALLGNEAVGQRARGGNFTGRDRSGTVSAAQAAHAELMAEYDRLRASMKADALAQKDLARILGTIRHVDIQDELEE